MPVRKQKAATPVRSHTRRTPAGKRAQQKNPDQVTMDLAAAQVARVTNPTEYLSEAVAAMEHRAESYDTTGAMSGERSFAATAAAFNAVTGFDLLPHHVALMQIMLKAVRAETHYNTHGTRHWDSAVDGAAYFALMAEQMETQQPRSTSEE